MSRKILSYVFLLGIIFLMGCSSTGLDSVNPAPENVGLYDAKLLEGDGGHVIWGAFKFYINPDDYSVDVVPNREMSSKPHYNVTSYIKPPECNDCIKVVMKKPDPVTRISEMTITLRNPTALPGFDVRGILILNDAGFNIKNPDGWTQVFDDGMAPYFNPFKRFAKLNDYGIFPGGESYTEVYMIYIPKPPNFAALDYVVEAVFPKKASREPYNITGEQIDGPLYTNGSNAVTLTVWVFDRNDDTLKVTIECPQIFPGTKNMIQQSDPKQWVVQFSNEKLAPVGNYDVTIEAFDTVVSYTLRDKIQVSVIEKTLYWFQTLLVFSNGDCSFDIAAADGGLFSGGGYLVNSDAGGTGFYGYSWGFGFPTPVVDLINLNPNNPSLQPLPPHRYDSALGGGLAFSNKSTGLFEDGANIVPLPRVAVTLDGMLFFQDDMAGDDSAHYPAGDTTLKIADICDGFQPRFYILWAENGGDDLPILRCYADNYTTKKQKIGVKIPAQFIGTGNGKIVNDAASILGIDANELDDDNVELYILEKLTDTCQVEIFKLYTDPITSVTEVTYLHTIDLPPTLGEACDIELLPPNPDYKPNPDAVNVVVPFRINNMGYFTGYINIYDSQTGELAEELGTPEMPVVFEKVRHVDVNNTTFTILLTSEIVQPELINMILFSFTYG